MEVEERAQVPGEARRVNDVDWQYLVDSFHGELLERETKDDATSSADGVGLVREALLQEGEPVAVEEVEEIGDEDKAEDDVVDEDRIVEGLSSLELDGESRMLKLLQGATVELDELRVLSWKGLSADTRPMCWKLLLGYLPVNAGRRDHALKMKRESYQKAVEQYWKTSDWSQDEEGILRQISVDIPRTCPGQKLFHIKEVQEILQRILFVWALKHPASGYVQGMNDLISPFVYVFLLERCPPGTENLLSCDSISTKLDSEQLFLAEADSYWCFTALLETIQDYYTFSQPGIQKRVLYLEEFIRRVDPQLREHMQQENLEFLQFSFRWLNCLLMRELPFELMLRVWDTYMSESDGFAVFHVYVCAALLSYFSKTLQGLDFQELVIFLQNLPTDNWTTKEVDMLLSQAFLWRTIFDGKTKIKDLKP